MPSSFPVIPRSSAGVRVSVRVRVLGKEAMGIDAALQTSLVALAAAVVVVGIWMMSFKKMMATYFFGLFGIVGILLPDWEFFDRDFSQWSPPCRRAEASPIPTPGDSYRRKVFFNYEKRIRLRSPPEKIFEYFASFHSPEGEVFLLPADLMRAVLPCVSSVRVQYH